MPILIIAIVAMLVQQTIATTAKLGMPAMFPTVAADLGIDPKVVLGYTWSYAAVAILVMAGCGGALRRWGALRTSQLGCLAMALGLAAAALLAQPWLALPPLVLGIFLNSAGSTVATPASSQILAKYAPPKWAPLVFSIKQTGVPAGLAISGMILAPIAASFGWRPALLGLAIVCIVIAVALQPLRAEFDADRDPTARPKFSDFPTTIRQVLNAPEMRSLAMAAFCFVGMQSIFMGFSVTYLHEALGYTVEAAGPIFGAAALIAVPARILWGWVGSTLIKPQMLLACLAAMMAVSTASMGLFGSNWAEWHVFAVMGLISLSVLSWHGVLLSEAARLAQAGEAGRMTGGVLAFGSAGQVIYPMIFGLGLASGSYIAGYVVIALPALFMAFVLVRSALSSRKDVD
jgi:fucose permease